MAHPQIADNPGRARPTAHGTWQPADGPADVHGHIQRLPQTPTFQAIGEAVQPAQLTVAPAPGQLRRADANGSIWRLRSLVAMGHTTGRIARALATPAHIIEPLIRGDRATITTGRADINRLYDAWWDKRPPRRTRAEKAAACKALQRAAVNNWPCPAAMDDDELDLPGYQPYARWRYATGTGTATDNPLGKDSNDKPDRRCRSGRTSKPAASRRQAG